MELQSCAHSSLHQQEDNRSGGLAHLALYSLCNVIAKGTDTESVAKLLDLIFHVSRATLCGI